MGGPDRGLGGSESGHPRHPESTPGNPEFGSEFGWFRGRFWGGSGVVPGAILGSNSGSNSDPKKCRPDPPEPPNSLKTRFPELVKISARIAVKGIKRIDFAYHLPRSRVFPLGRSGPVRTRFRGDSGSIPGRFRGQFRVDSGPRIRVPRTSNSGSKSGLVLGGSGGGSGGSRSQVRGCPEPVPRSAPKNRERFVSMSKKFANF